MYKQATCALIIIGRFFGGKNFKGCTEVSSIICYTIVTQFAIRK